MKTENIVEYIKLGLTIKAEPKLYRVLVCGSGSWAVLGAMYGLVLGEYWKYIAFFMIAIFLVAVIVVSLLSAKVLTIKRRLLIQTVIYASWVFQISLLELLFFTMEYGFRLELLVLYLPNVFVPFVLGFIEYNMLKTGKRFYVQTVNTKKTMITGGVLGVCVMRFATHFKDISQDNAILYGLICLMLLCALFSVGFVNVQRLYYIMQLKRKGIVIDDY